MLYIHNMLCCDAIKYNFQFSVIINCTVSYSLWLHYFTSNPLMYNVRTWHGNNNNYRIWIETILLCEQMEWCCDVMYRNETYPVTTAITIHEHFCRYITELVYYTFKSIPKRSYNIFSYHFNIKIYLHLPSKACDNFRAKDGMPYLLCHLTILIKE